MTDKLAIFCPTNLRDNVFPIFVLDRLSSSAGAPPLILSTDELRKHLDGLGNLEYLFGTWGMPRLDATFLEKCPKLKAVFYAAGSVKSFVTDSVFERGIRLCSAWKANGIPVAEFTISVILLSLKRFWHESRAMREGLPARQMQVAGGYRSKVGLLSLGAIGRMVLDRLLCTDIEVAVYDPFLRPEQAKELGVELLSLDRIFSDCDVVSIHTPWLPETEGLVTGKLIASMKPGATLVNTARGAVVAEREMIDVLGQRRDLTAVLDVTHPEPPPQDSPLRSLPNVVLTPHIAGSMDRECARMAMWMIDEFERLRKGEPLQHEITQDVLRFMA